MPENPAFWSITIDITALLSTILNRKIASIAGFDEKSVFGHFSCRRGIFGGSGARAKVAAGSNRADA
jgi:hypothetical protein